jgi:hypothetical protein
MKTKVAALSIFFSCIPRKRISPLLIALSLLAVASCKDDDPAPGQTAGCRLVLQTNTVSGRYDDKVTFTYVAKLGHAYDDNGNETGSTVTYDYQYSDGTTSVSTGTTSKQYDDQGFLQRTINQSNRTERDKSTAYSTYNTEYVYENGRLTKSTSLNTYTGYPNRTDTYLYEYNTDGSLTKFTDVSSGRITTIEYSGKKISKITRTDAKGVSNSPFFEYNSKGFLVKWIETNSGYTEEYRYAYDDNGQVTRRERYINGEPSSADDTEYDTRHSPYGNLSAQPKGHPIVPSLYSGIVNKNNAVRSIYYNENATGTGFAQRSSTISTYDYNASNFPVSATSKTFDKDGTETSTNSSVYQYEGCN